MTMSPSIWNTIRNNQGPKASDEPKNCSGAKTDPGQFCEPKSTTSSQCSPTTTNRWHPNPSKGWVLPPQNPPLQPPQKLDFGMLLHQIGGNWGADCTWICTTVGDPGQFFGSFDALGREKPLNISMLEGLSWDWARVNKWFLRVCSAHFLVGSSVVPYRAMLRY